MKLEKFLRNKNFRVDRKLTVYGNEDLIYRGLHRGTREHKILNFFKDYKVVKVDALIREFVIFI